MERDWTGEIREDAWREHGIRSEPEHHRGELSIGRVDSEVDGHQLMAWDERQTWARFPTSPLPVLRDGLEQL